MPGVRIPPNLPWALAGAAASTRASRAPPEAVRVKRFTLHIARISRNKGVTANAYYHLEVS